MSGLRDLARHLGLGRALRRIYHRPVGRVRDSIRNGGPLEQRRTEAGRRAMIEAARALPPLEAPDADGGEVHYLTGARYWYQTLFCFASIQARAPVRLTPVLWDDGSLEARHREHVLRVVPWTRVVGLDAIEARLDRVLPWSRYPVLRERRVEQPLIRKVLDLHAGEHGWKLLLDSDMLAFRRAGWLLDWLASDTKKPAYMVDAVEAYGYSESIRARLVGGKTLPERANIGIFGWRSEDLDIDWLEHAVGTLIREEGLHYNLTQGVASLLFAGRDCDVAPADDYLVLPGLDEGREPTAVLHHYVAESKRSYFQHGWRRVLRDLGAR